MTFIRFTEIAGPAIYTIAGTAAQLVSVNLDRGTRTRIYTLLLLYLSLSTYILQCTRDRSWTNGSMGSAWKLTGTLLSMVASSDAVAQVSLVLRQAYPNNDIFLLIGPVLLLLGLVLATALTSPSTPSDQVQGTDETFSDLGHVLSGVLIMVALSASDVFVAVVLSGRARYLGWRPIWAGVAAYIIIRSDTSLGFAFKKSTLSLQWAALTQTAMYVLARFAAVGYSSVAGDRHGDVDLWLWVAAISLASIVVSVVSDEAGRMVSQQAIVSAAIFAANAQVTTDTVRGPLLQGVALVVWAGGRVLQRSLAFPRASPEFAEYVRFVAQLLDAISSTLIIQMAVSLFQDESTRTANTTQLVVYVALVIGIACASGPL